MWKHMILWLLIGCMLIGSAAAAYPYVGYDGFQTDASSIFGQSHIDFSTRTITSTKTLTHGRYAPLVADLDGDGTNEIIVNDYDTIRIYRNTTLDIVDAYTVAGSQVLTPPVVRDMDGDGLLDVVVVNINASPNVAYFLEYNGSAFQADATVSLTGTLANLEAIVGCGDEGQCLMAETEYKNPSNGNNDLLAVAFNHSAASAPATIDTGVGNEIFCLPSVPFMQYGDFDADGQKSFSFTFGLFQESNEDYVSVYVVDDDLSPAADQVISQQITSASAAVALTVSVATSRCYNMVMATSAVPWYSALANGLWLDADGAYSNGQELFLPYMYSYHEAALNAYSSSGALLKSFPRADATFFTYFISLYTTTLSNPFVLDLFDDSSNVDVCMLGYNDRSSWENIRLNAMCGSLVGGANAGGSYYYAAYNETWSFPYRLYSTHTMSAPQVFTGTAYPLLDDTQDMAVSTYGALAFEDDTPYSPIINPVPEEHVYDELGYHFGYLEIMNANPIGGESVLITQDYQGNALQDWIGMTQNNLYYIDDRFVNTPAQITAYTINPCIESIIKANESMNIQITVDDINSDAVAARAVVYGGMANEQDSGWANYSDAGTIFSFTFSLNQTGQNIPMTLYGRDDQNPDDAESITLYFSVAATGVEYGDCITSYTHALTTENATGEVAAGELDTENNAIINAFDDSILAQFGLGHTLLWIIVMFIAAMAVVMVGHNAIITLFGLVVTQVLLLFMGVYLGFISSAIIIILAVILFLIAGLWLAAKFTNTGGA